MRENSESAVERSGAEIVLPIKISEHAYFRLAVYCRQIGKRPLDCASELFEMMIADDEFDAMGESCAMH